MRLTSSKGDIRCIEGTNRILLVAPHAFDGDHRRNIGKDDENTGKLAREMGTRFGFYAVINEKYKRVDTLRMVNIERGLIDCNRIDQVNAYLKTFFLNRIISFKDDIIRKCDGGPLIVHLHGAHDTSFETYTRRLQDLLRPGILIGYGQGGVTAEGHLTASETLVDRLASYLTRDNGSDIRAAKTDPDYSNYCGRDPNNLNQLFRCGPYADPRVQSIQIEIKKAYRHAHRLAETAHTLGAALSKLEEHLLPR